MSFDEDYLHEVAFGDWSVDGYDISRATLNDINKIRRNDPSFKSLSIHFKNNYFSSSAWKMFGRYIARNDYLKEIDLSGMYLDESDISKLFSEMTIGKSVGYVSLSNGSFSVAACDNMLPFLKNSRNLKDIDITYCETFDTKCFDVVMQALSGGPIESLILDYCGVDSITATALEHCSFPHLNHLGLRRNKIVSKMSGLKSFMGLETLCLHDNPIDNAGCVDIAKLLKKDSALVEFSLTGSTNIDDVGAEILADSLKHNKTLYNFEMEAEKMTEKGGISFLKLACDISSIERTYNSNHVCRANVFPHGSDSIIKRYVELTDEKTSGSAKVIEFQLNSQKREELCRLQGIVFCYNSIFAEIDPLVLPDVLELVGRHHGQTELYRMLVAAVSELGSIVYREAVVNQMIAEKTAQIVALTTDIRDLHKELEWIKSGRGNENSRTRGKKRRRSASF